MKTAKVTEHLVICTQLTFNDRRGTQILVSERDIEIPPADAGSRWVTLTDMQGMACQIDFANVVTVSTAHLKWEDNQWKADVSIPAPWDMPDVLRENYYTVEKTVQVQPTSEATIEATRAAIDQAKGLRPDGA